MPRPPPSRRTSFRPNWAGAFSFIIAPAMMSAPAARNLSCSLFSSPLATRHSPLPSQNKFVIPSEARNLLFLPNISTFNLQLSPTATSLQIHVNFRVHDHRNVFPPFPKLHHLSALPRYLRPSRFGVRILFQSPQFSILKTEIHLSLFAFRRVPHTPVLRVRV